MNRRLACVATLLISLLAALNAWAQSPTGSDQQAPTQAHRTESFWQKLLRISGISDSPSTLKGPGDETESGQIWLVEVGPKTTHRLTASGGYRSPVFMPGSNDILALKGTGIVRLPPAGGQPKKLYTISGITKLVGFSLDDPDKVLLLTADNAGHSEVGLVSVSTGRIIPVAYDPASNEDRHMLEHLQNWDRIYGNKSVYVKRQTKQSLSGPVEWTDIYLKVGMDEPVNVSKCDEVNCGQPSLSADGQLLVFIRAEQE